MAGPSTASVSAAQASTSTAPRPLPPSIRKLVLQTFTKKYSLQLHASALTFIASTLDSHDLLYVVAGDDELESAQREAIEVLAKGCLDLGVLEEAGGGAGSIVTAKQLQHVYEQLVADGQQGEASTSAAAAAAAAMMDPDISRTQYESILNEEGAPPPDRWFDVVDSFAMPRVQWDSVAKTFVK